jgi:hypothetical protein
MTANHVLPRLERSGRARKEFCASRRPEAECAGPRTSQLLPGGSVAVAIERARAPGL